MTGRTREEVLARIKTYRADLKHWADRFNEQGEMSAFRQVEDLRARIHEMTWVLEALPEQPAPARTVYLLNGPYEGQKARVVPPEDPEALTIRGVIYKLIKDPDTGKSLGAYFWSEDE
ncbi:hypothetical protein SEA_ZOOMAN_55 [Microbacterium phage Zooman]|nr:hypothetical protein SEA_ZOOMAN_55 [Microbacterium phage Zooman]